MEMAKRITEIDGKELRYSRDFSFEKVKYYSDIGYKPPFRLLLDGSVVENLFLSDFEKLASVASKILKEDVLIFVSKCSLGEAELSQARESPYCSIPNCDHPQDRIDPAECIRKLIGVDNSFKFFLVTNNEGVAKNYANLQIAYGVPVMVHSSKGLCLMPPRKTEAQLQELNEQEQRDIRKRKRNKLRKMRQMDAAKKEGDGYFDQAAVYSRKKAANRARKRQRELEEQQQQQQQQQEAEA